jgi:Holliday junction DNA helicase RuvB
MVVKIVDHYVNGVFVKRTEKITLEEQIPEVGEILLKPTFSDVIYEPSIKQTMKLIIEKAKYEKINILFYGSAGTGKTYSAKMIACETRRPFVYLTGSMAKKKILNFLLSAKKGSLVLIDEIHNIPEKVAEIIYPAIQDGELYLDGKHKDVGHLMFVGTTTEPQDLPKPLRERFKQIELNEPDASMLKEILMKKGCTPQVAVNLLNFTHNLRILGSLLEMMWLYGELDEKSLSEVFKLRKINISTGLSHLQEQYLEILKNVGKMGLRTLALQLRKSEDYVKYEIEPDLIRKGLINITSRGRELIPDNTPSSSSS